MGPSTQDSLYTEVVATARTFAEGTIIPQHMQWNLVVARISWSPTIIISASTLSPKVEVIQTTSLELSRPPYHLLMAQG